MSPAVVVRRGADGIDVLTEVMQLSSAGHKTIRFSADDFTCITSKYI